MASKPNQDKIGGALVFLVGLFAMVQGETYNIGTLYHMGAGFLPVAVGAIMAFMGLAIAVRARFAAPVVAEARLKPEWRSWILISFSIVAFIVFGIYGGLVPATFAIVFISALADRQNTLISAALLALGMVVICVIIFWWALQLPFPLFRWG